MRTGAVRARAGAALVLGLLAASAAVCSPASADPAQDVRLTQCTVTPCEPYPPFGWEGEFRSQRIELRSRRTGARLAGTVFAPPARAARRGRHPLVVIVPGSGGTAREEHYHWSARELAAHGYVVVGVDPQGVGRSATFGEDGCDPAAATEDLEYPYPCPGVPFQQRTNFDDAALSAIAWGAGRANPYRRLVDADRVGVAGHSLGAAAAIAAQEHDRRVRAIVAWDGMAGKEMATDTNAPTHHLVNGHVPVGEQFDRDNEVRAPALGLHSDHETTSPYDTDPQKKNRGWWHWRRAGMPTAIFTMRGLTHGGYGQSETGGDSDALRRLQWYTRAWFDRFLKDDRTAEQRLLATEVLGQPRDQALSAGFPSSVFLPERGIDCADLRDGCPAIG